MFRQAERTELPRILDYYKKDLRNCLYGYIDVQKYGIDDPNLSLYFDENGDGIHTVITEYCGGLQLYSFDNRGDLNNILSFLKEKNSPMLNGEQRLLRQIYPFLKGSYTLETGIVLQMKQCRMERVAEEVEMAREEDYMEIARLICSDRELGGFWSSSQLCRQLLKRSREKFGRNFIIRRNGKIVCHAATYAEADRLAVIGGVITKKGYRRQGLAEQTVGELCRQLLAEGKIPHLFCYKENAGRIYRKLGFDSGSGWGRLLRMEEERSL